MNNYQKNITVSSAEAENLKELIFKRARERAEAIENQTKTAYTDNVKSDVMDIARESIVSVGRNPFQNIIEQDIKQQESVEVTTPKVNTETVEETKLDYAEAAKQKANAIKAQILNNNKNLSKTNSDNTVNDTMLDAQKDFSNRKMSFMGALNFLNAQATITLVNKQNQSFSAIV